MYISYCKEEYFYGIFGDLDRLLRCFFTIYLLGLTVTALYSQPCLWRDATKKNAIFQSFVAIS